MMENTTKVQGPPMSQGFSDLQAALAPLVKQLEKLEDRTRDMITRADLEALRKDVVQRDLLEAQLRLLTTQIARLEADRLADRKTLEERIEKLETEQASRSERFWMKMGPAVAAIALIISAVEFLMHVKIVP